MKRFRIACAMVEMVTNSVNQSVTSGFAEWLKMEMISPFEVGQVREIDGRKG